ncbi:hypothetical protein Tco_1370902 [Tanacetum coccineum]
MDPNTSIGRLCLGVDDHVSLNDGFESEGQWEGPEYQDTTESMRKKRLKHSLFIGWRRKKLYEKNMISNEFAIKLCLDYEEKEGEKVMKKELLVALRGELYFVKFIIKPEEDDVEPRVLFVEVKEEAATEEVIRNYKAIKEKNDHGVFVLPILLEAKFDLHAIADTGSNIKVMPYRIYEKLRKRPSQAHKPQNYYARPLESRTDANIEGCAMSSIGYQQMDKNKKMDKSEHGNGKSTKI